MDLSNGLGGLTYRVDIRRHRRFQKWSEEGVLEQVLRRLAEDLRETEAFIDGSHSGALLLEVTRRGKATKVMAVADRAGLPVAVGIESGQRNEQELVVWTLEKSFLENELPKLLIGEHRRHRERRRRPHRR